MAWTVSGSGQPRRPGLPGRQRMAVAHHAHVLLGEQGVAAGRGQQGRADAGGEPVGGQEVLQQMAGVGLRQRFQLDGDGRAVAPAPARPAGQQVAAGGGHQQQRGLRRGPGAQRAPVLVQGRVAGRVQQLLEEVEQGVVGPVQVLQHQHQRPPVGQPVQEAPPGGERLVAPAVPVGGGHGAALGRAGELVPLADQPAQVPRDPVDGGRVVGHGVGDHPGQAAGDPVGRVGLEDAGLGLDDLGQGPVGHPAAGGGAALVPGRGAALPPGDQVAVGVEGPPELGHQPGLADAGRAEQGDEPGAALGLGPLERLQQDAQLAVAADQRHRPGGQGVHPGAVARLQRAPHAHRLGPPGQGEQAGRAVADRPLGGAAGRLRHQHGPARGGLLEPGADGHRVARDPRAVGDQGLAGGHGDPQLRPATGPGEGVADGQGGPDGPLGVVLAGLGDPEGGHGDAADGVLDGAAEALDLGPDPVQVAVEHAGDVLGVAFPGLAERLVDLGEQHRDELALHGPALGGGPVALVGVAVVVVGLGGARAGRDQQVEGRVLGQDGLFQPLQADAGLDPELVDQDLAGRPVGGQGVGLAARAVQGQHQLAVEVLAQGVQPDQRLQLGHQLVVAAEGQLGLDPGLGGGHLELLDADQLRPGEVGRGGHVGQCRTPPQGERLAQQVGRARRVAGGQGLAALAVQALEAVQVEALGVDPEQVAGVAGDQGAGRAGAVAGLDRLAQGGHVVLERLLDRRWGLLAPDGLDQLLGRDDLVGMEQQFRQQHPVLDAAEPQRPFALACFQRAEEEEVDRAYHHADLRSFALVAWILWLKRYEPNTRECICHATEYLDASLGVDELAEGLGRADLLQPLGEGRWQVGQRGVEVAHPGGHGAARRGGWAGPPPSRPSPATRPWPAPTGAGWPGPPGRRGSARSRRRPAPAGRPSGGPGRPPTSGRRRRPSRARSGRRSWSRWPARRWRRGSAATTR